MSANKPKLYRVLFMLLHFSLFNRRCLSDNREISLTLCLETQIWRQDKSNYSQLIRNQFHILLHSQQSSTPCTIQFYSHSVLFYIYITGSFNKHRRDYGLKKRVNTLGNHFPQKILCKIVKYFWLKLRLTWTKTHIHTHSNFQERWIRWHTLHPTTLYMSAFTVSRNTMIFMYIRGMWNLRKSYILACNLVLSLPQIFAQTLCLIMECYFICHY